MTIDVSTLAVEVRSKGVKETSDGLNKIFIEAGKAERRVQTLTASIDKLSRVFDSGSASARAYQEAVAQASRRVGGHNDSTVALTKALSAMVATMTRLNAKMDATSFDRATGGMNRHTAAMRDAHAAARGLAGSLGALWMTYGNLAPLAAGLAIGASFKGIVKVGTELEHTLEGIRVRGQESVQSINEIRQAVYKLGEGIYGPQKVAEAFEVLILAGLNAKQAMGSVTAALNLALVGGISIEKSASTLVQVGTAMGYAAENYAIVGDIISKTAAVSMSSVESLSGSFKSAAVVGSLYGATLVDVGTSLAALSQLGISHSAAGTSLKNMYAELGSSAEKVKNAFKDMRLAPDDLKDQKGDFKDIVTMFTMMDEKLSKLGTRGEKAVIAALTNERGVKQFMANLELVRQKVILADGTMSNMLAVNQQKIMDSYGFAAIGAVQMAMTSKNQMLSIINTLQTTFAKVFRDIEPEMNVFSARMKEIFSGEEFKSAITGAARLMSSFAVAVAENLPLIAKLVVVLLAVKAAMIAQAVWAAAAAGVTMLATAFSAMLAGTLTLSMALPALAIVLGTVAVAWKLYNMAKGDTNPTAAKANAEAYSKNYIDGLVQEAERLDAVTKKMKENKSAAEAMSEVDKDQSRQKMKSLQVAALAEAEENRDRAKKALGNMSATDLASAEKNGLNSGLSQVRAYAEAVREVEKTKEKINNQNLIAQRAEETLKTKAIENRAAADEDARKRRAEIEAEYSVPTHPQKGAAAAASDRYQAELNRIQGQVKAAQRDLLAVEQDADAQYKSGQIGRLEFLSRTSNAAIDMYNREAVAYQRMLDTAAPKNREAVKASIGNKLIEAQDNASREVVKLKVQEAARFAEVERFTTEHQVKELEARGKYVQANVLKYSGSYKLGMQQLQGDIDKTEADMTGAIAKMGEDGGKALSELTDKLQLLRAAKAAFIAEGDAKGKVALFNETEFAFKIPFKEMQTAIEAVNMAAEADGGWEAKFDAAGAAARIRQQALPALTALADKLRTVAAESGNDSLIKQAEAITRSVQEVSLTFNTMWQEAAAGARTLGDTLESAFGPAVGAIGKLVSAMADQKAAQERINNALSANIQLAKGDKVKIAEAETKAAKASAQAQMKSYADVAGSAKMFFKEHTAGYKILAAVEKGFRMAEMAMAYEAMIRKIFFTEAVTAATVVGNETSASSAVASAAVEIPAAMGKAQANAIGAVANQGNGDPYSAFFRIAAMAAIMAGLGLMVGGGGGGSSIPEETTAAWQQERQGTGTVLGDETAKSESIVNSLEILQSNSDIALTHTANMLSALRNIRDGIAGMAAFVSQSTGLRGTKADGKALGVGAESGFLGFSSSSTELVDTGLLVATTVNDVVQTIGTAMRDGISAQGYSNLHKEESSWWGLFQDSSDETVLSDLRSELTNSMADTIGALYEGVIAAAETLGQDRSALSTALQAVTLESGGLSRISLMGMTGVEIEKELQAVFGSLGDRMAEIALPGVKTFQKVGEGAFQTLVRVASGVDVANYELEKLGITAISYTEILNRHGDVATEIVRQSITATERQGDALTNIGRIISTMDGTVSDLTDMYTSLVALRDLMTAAGLNGAGMSLNTIRGAGGVDALQSGLSDFTSNFYNEAERQAIRVRLLTEQFSALGLTMPATRDAFRDMVLAADDGSEAGDKLVGKLLTLAGAFSEVQGGVEDAARALVDNAMEAVDVSMRALSRAVEAERKANTATYEAAKAAIKKQTDLDTAAQKLRLTAAQDAVKAVQSVFDSITNAIKSTAVESAELDIARRRAAQMTLRGALAFSNGGGSLAGFAGMSDALSAISKPSEQMFATFEDYARDQGQTAFVLEGLAANAKKEVSTAQLTIDAINGTIEAIKTASDAALEALESQHKKDMDYYDLILQQAQDQIDALNGVDTSIKTLTQAMQEFTYAVAKAAGIKGIPVPKGFTDGTKPPSATATASGGGTSGTGATGVDRTVSEGGGTLSADGVGKMTIADVGILRAGYSPDILKLAQIRGWTDTQLAGYYNTQWGVAGNWTPATVQLERQFAANMGMLPSFDEGTNWLPDDMTANVHEGERIVPKADNIELMRRLSAPEGGKESSAEVAALIVELINAIKSGDLAIVQRLGDMLKLSKRWDGEGMPPTRPTT
jgi:hypothetical protein